MSDGSPRLQAFYRCAAQLQFPGTPSLWTLDERDGPWARIVLAIGRWYEEWLTPEEVEELVSAELAARRIELADAVAAMQASNRRAANPRGIDPAQAERKAANTAALLAALKGA